MEIAVFVLDAGPAMSTYLEAAGQALSHLVLAKMMNKPAHRLAIIFYGTTGTDNPLHEEFVADGDDSQYEHIKMMKPLSMASCEHLDIAANVPGGEGGSSDFLDALTVAVDTLRRATGEEPELAKPKVAKRITVVSCLQQPAKDDPGGEFTTELCQKLVEQGIRLEVVVVGGEGGPEPRGDASNEELLCTIQQRAGGLRVRRARGPLELLSTIKFKEVSASTQFAGDLTFGRTLSVPVKVTKKTMQERVPTLKRHSEEAATSSASHAVLVESTVRLAAPKAEAHEAEEVKLEEMTKAYQYGKDLVPVDREVEQRVRYAPEKGLKAAFAIPAEDVPRSLLLGDTWLVAADKKEAGAGAAVAAIAATLRQRRLALVVRFVPRQRSNITLALIQPHSPGTAPETLLMAALPFEADVRPCAFPAFDSRPELRPDTQQVAAMDAAIDALMLADEEGERLPPDRTGNPSLHKFLDTAVARKLGRDDPPAEGGLLEKQALQPQWQGEQAQRALARVAELFETEVEEPASISTSGRGEEAAAASTVSSATPLEDFEFLLGRNAHAAFAGLEGAMRQLIALRSYPKAVECLQRLFGAAKQLHRAKQFNYLFRGLAKEFEGCAEHGNFWAAVAETSIQLMPEQDATT